MSRKTNATQDFVPIKEIRDGIAVLKDDSLRAILLASSLNFSLKSDDERAAILIQFQDFLNSLDFSIQIFIQSRRLDIRPYISLLEQQEKKQLNDLMKIQTQEYIEFIKDFTENTSIMTKHFFIVIPYSPAPLQGKNKGGFGVFKMGKKEDRVTEKEIFEEKRTQLDQSGIRVAHLGTEEIVELFYKIFNPGDAEKPIQLNQ